MTKTAKEPLARGEAQRLRALEGKLAEELDTLNLAGLGDSDRAAKARDDLQVVRWRRERDLEAHQEEQDAKWRRKEEQDRREARRKADHEDAVARALPWLKQRLAQGPVVETDLFNEGLLENIFSGAMHEALEKVGARGVYPVQGRRGRTLVDRGPKCWTLGIEGLYGGLWVSER